MSRSDPRDDATLAQLASQGERDALEILLDRHMDRVHAICRRVLSNPQDALDATQEALIAIARGIRGFDNRSQFTTWLYRVATNAALDEARRHKRRPVPSEFVPERADPGPALDTGVIDRLDVDAALATLPPEFRAAVALRDLMGCDYAEIAQILGIPPGTVRSRIARGRSTLAAHLGNQDDPSVRLMPQSDP